MIAPFNSLSLIDGNRVIVFSVTGKRFWVWDVCGLLAFIHGQSFQRMVTAGARVPTLGPAEILCHDVRHVEISVPGAVAERTRIIAYSLFNQAVLSSMASFSFCSLAVATYKMRPVLSAEVYGKLCSLSTAANEAKHVGCGSLSLAGTGLIFPSSNFLAPGGPAHCTAEESHVCDQGALAFDLDLHEARGQEIDRGLEALWTRMREVELDRLHDPWINPDVGEQGSNG